MADDLRNISLEAFLESEGVRTGAAEVKRYLDDLGDAARKFGNDLDHETGRAGQAMAYFGGEVVGVISAAFSLNNLIDTFRTLNQIVVEGTEAQKAFFEQGERFRKENTKYAGIVGRVPNRQFLEEQLQLQIATGANQQQASEFMKGFTNEGQLAIGVNIDPDEARKYQELMLRWTVSRRMEDSERVGSIAGALLRKGEFQGPGGGEKAFNEAAQAVEVLNIGSGDLTAIMKASNQVWQQLGSTDENMGIFRNFGEAAFTVSLAAQSNDRRAWTGINQAASAIRNFSGDFAPTLTEAGIKPEDSFINSLAKFSTWAKDTVKAENKPLDTLLIERGLDDLHARISLSAMAQNFDLETTQKQLQLIRQDPAAFGADAMKGIEAFDKEVGIDLKAQQVNEASKLRKGMEGFDLARYRNLAEAALRAEGKIDSDSARFGEWVASAASLGVVSRDQIRQDVIDRRLGDLVGNKAREVGLETVQWQGHGQIPVDQLGSLISNALPDQRNGAVTSILQQISKQLEEQTAAIKQMKAKNPPLPSGREISSSGW